MPELTNEIWENRAKALQALRSWPEEKHTTGAMCRDGKLCATAVVAHVVFDVPMESIDLDPYNEDPAGTVLQNVYNVVAAGLGVETDTLWTLNDTYYDPLSMRRPTLARIADMLEESWALA